MRNTIKAKNGYIVKQRKSDPTQVRVYDGEDFLFEGERRSYEDYVEEVVNEGNEMAKRSELFTTTKGYQFIYWRDDEADWDSMTKIV